MCRMGESMKMTIVCAALACAVLAGCATAPPRQQTSEDVRLGTVVVDEKLNTHLVIRSPSLVPRRSDAGLQWVRLIATVSRQTGAVSYFVRYELEHTLGGWQFFDQATYLDQSGGVVKATGFSRSTGDVSCSGASCRYSEAGMFSVLKDELRLHSIQAKPNDLTWQIRFFGRRGYTDVAIQRDLIPGFLAAVDAATAPAAK